MTCFIKRHDNMKRSSINRQFERYFEVYLFRRINCRMVRKNLKKNKT